LTTKTTEIAVLTPEEQAVYDEKMNKPLEDMPITMQTLISIQHLPAIPEHYRGKPKEMMAAALLGREIGVGPMTSINMIDLIDGSVSLRAKLVSALILRDGHVLVVTEQSNKRAAMRCFRWHKQTNDLIDVGELEYTIEDATAAGDAKKDTYKKHLKAMLTNRLLTLIGRTVFSDCLTGFAYTAEEIGMSTEVEDIPEAHLEISDLDAAVNTVEVILDGEEV